MKKDYAIEDDDNSHLTFTNLLRSEMGMEEGKRKGGEGMDRWEGGGGGKGVLCKAFLFSIPFTVILGSALHKKLLLRCAECFQCYRELILLLRILTKPSFFPRFFFF